MKNPVGRAALTLGLVLVGLCGTSPAHAADSSPEPEQIVLGDTPIEAGTADKVTATEFEEARDDGAVDVPASEKADVVHDVVANARANGQVVDPKDVDVVSLYDGDVLVGLQESTTVESMTIAAGANEQDLTVTLKGTETPDSIPATTAGHGMALSWAGNGSGEYVIKIYQGSDLKLDGRFTWNRKKLLGDGQPTLVHYAYSRFGDAQPSAQAGPDPRVDELRIQNFPYDSIEPSLRNWDRYDPGGDRADNCNPYNATISYGALSLSVPFSAGCGVYNMWRNVDKPSSYYLEYLTPGLGSDRAGNRQVGYVIMWSQKEGTPGSQHDLQKIRLGWPSWYPGAYETCTQTDASRTC